MSAAPDVEPALRVTLAILNRASDRRYNGDPHADGPLHWPVAIHFARDELRRALEALTEDRPPPARRRDAERGDSLSY
jgi:hypothetical protein